MSIDAGSRAKLEALASVLRARDAINREVTALIARPASTGNLGEFIAAHVFDIQLVESGVNPGYDGFFMSGSLKGMSVNVKMYSQNDALLDISPHPADYYLVIRGPRAAAMKGPKSLPFRIDSVYLFEMATLRARLDAAGIRQGVATSVRQAVWQDAQIFPVTQAPPIELTVDQIECLGLFLEHSSAVT